MVGVCLLYSNLIINPPMFCVQVGGSLFQSDAVKGRRHSLTYTAHSRRNPESSSSYIFQQRPKASVNTGERFIYHPDQKKDKLENREHKTSHCSNMSLQKVQFKPYFLLNNFMYDVAPFFK